MSQEHGLFRCLNDAGQEPACASFAPGATDLLVTSQPYKASVLPDAVLAFGAAQGLPPGWIEVQPMAGGVVFVNQSGLFRLADPAVDAVRFVPDTAACARIARPRSEASSEPGPDPTFPRVSRGTRPAPVDVPSVLLLDTPASD